MKHNRMKKIAAGCLALLIVAGTMPVQPLAPLTEQIMLTARAEPDANTATLEDGVLTLHGNVSRDQVRELVENKEDSITAVVAEEGTVLPADCTNLFSGYQNCTSIDLSKADTSHVESMESMFGGCAALEELTLGPGIGITEAMQLPLPQHDWEKWYTPDYTAISGDGEYTVIAAPTAEATYRKLALCGDKCYWKYDDATATLTISGEGAMWDADDYKSPKWYAALPKNAYGCLTVATVVVEDGVTSIGAYVFGECDSLASVTLPESLTRIGCNAFTDCTALTTLTIPEGVTEIDGEAFFGSGLKSISLPASVTTMFKYTNEQGETYQSSPFLCCNSLESIKVDAKNPKFSSVNGVLFDKEQTVLYCCPASYPDESMSYEIPDGVETIFQGAFYNIQLEKVTVPASLKCLSAESLASESLQSICYNTTKTYFEEEVNAADEYAYEQTKKYFSIAACDIAELPDVTFDGEHHKPALTIKDGETTLTEDVDYSVEYGENLLPGAASVTITGMGEYWGETTVEFTIINADVAVTPPTALELTYDGSPRTLVNDGETDHGTLMYALGTDAETAPETGWTSDLGKISGTAAGKYYVWYYVDGGDYYNSTKPAVVEVEIAKADAGFAVNPSGDVLTYNATAQALLQVEGQTKDGTLLYSLDGKTYSAVPPTATDAGTYNVYYYIKGDDNHKDSEPKSVTAKIRPAELDLEWPDENAFTYDGTEHSYEPTLLGVLGDDTVPLVYENGTSVDAGEFTVEVSLPATVTNYKLVGGNEVQTWYVRPAKLAVYANKLEKAYGDADPELTYTVEGLVKGDKLTGALSREAGETVGSYPITPGTLSAGDNYNLHFTSSNLSISPKQLTPQWSSGSFLYDGTEKTVTAQIDGVVDGDDVTVTYDGASATDAGTYYAEAELDGEDAYNYDLEDAGYVWEIKEAPFPLTVKGYNGFYDGTPHGITLTGDLEDAEIRYSTEPITGDTEEELFGAWMDNGDETPPTFTDAGTYSVYFFVNKHNYELLFAGETVKIEPKDASGAAVELAETTYTADGKAKKPAAVVTLDGTELTEGTDYTVAYSNNTKPGTATVTVTFTGNYTGTAKATFTIEEAPTEATDPTEPTEGTEPTEATEPTDATDPTDAIDPTDATDPTDAIDPTDATDSTDEIDPTELAETTEPDEEPDSNGACYVATCVYGSYDCPEVWTLRRFRDYTLAETWYGRAFVHTYYAISPTIVKWFGDTAWFKAMWRGVLDSMVADLQSKGVENTPYKDRNW